MNAPAAAAETRSADHQVRRPARHIRAVGGEAALIECADIADVRAVTAFLDDQHGDDVAEVVPAMATVLVVARPRRVDEMLRAVQHAAASRYQPPERPAAGLIRIEVRYGGADLAAVADDLGVSAAELVHRHTRIDWHVAFVGFTPGFGYLHSADWPFRPPRHPTPRLRVAAGSLAIADGFCGVYPHPSPSGWHRIGHTDAPVWDVARPQPALLAPGAVVRFIDVSAG